jgi:DNA-binding helix-hairpin-helix protein with protein kinase domain
MTQPGVRELPAVGDMLAMDRTGEPLRVVQLIGEGGQGLVYRVQLRTGAPLALKWYRRNADTPQQRESIKKLASRRCPHPAFLFPLDMVTDAHVASFGYVMPWMESRFTTFAAVVNDPKPLGLQTKAKIGRKLAEAFNALHAGGLCYRDINFGNLWADPACGDIAVIDNDNVGIDEGFAAVWGSLRFMAPEVIRREHKPSTITDLHSLAVLLFYLLMHGHPLDGRKVESSYTWDPGKHRSEEELALRHYGHEPVFSFDPADDSNRPTQAAGPAAWWPVYPGFVQKLFIQAFTVGLRDASLGGRVLAGTWRDALAQMHDLCMVCANCSAALVYDPDQPNRGCWHCATVPIRPPILRLRGGRSSVLLADRAVLTNHHVANDRDYDTVAAVVESHPRAPSGLVLRNRSKLTWTTQPTGESRKAVEPGQAFAIRTASVNFGAVSGEIVA